MANKKAKKAATRASTVPANQATMVVTLYDGTREPIEGQDFLIGALGFSGPIINSEGSQFAEPLVVREAVFDQVW